MSTDVLCPF